MFYSENVTRMYIVFIFQGKASVFRRLFKKAPKKLTSLPAQEVEAQVEYSKTNLSRYVFGDRQLHLINIVCWCTNAS